MTLEEAKKDMLKFVQLKTSMALRPAFLDPLLNAVEERHGHWTKSCRCSECDGWGLTYSDAVSGKYKYCPNCGAKMDEEEE